MKIILLLLLVAIIKAKVVVKEFNLKQLRNNKWFFLTKFGSHIGTSNYEFKFSLVNGQDLGNHKITLNAGIYLDTTWDDDLKLDQCEVVKYSKYSEDVAKCQCSQPLIKKGTLKQTIRQHLWYFVFDDCERTLLEYLKSKTRATKLRVELNLLNSENSQFSSEQSGMIPFLFCVTILNFALFYFYYKKARSEYKKYDEIDWALVIIIIAIGLDALQSFCLLSHYIKYSQNGVGIIALEIISELLQVVSRLLIICLMILLSWGWSLTYIELESYDIYIALGIIVGLIQTTIVGLGRLTDETQIKYHHFDGFVGYLTCVIEIGLFLYYVFGIRSTYKQCGNYKIKAFVREFSIYAGLFLMGFTILLLISKIFSPYLRFKVILIGTFLLRTFASLLLAQLFTSKQSNYRDILYKNQSMLDRNKQD